jgi:hypothetical protein
MAYDPGIVSYDLDASEAGPWFIVYSGSHAGGFDYGYTGTFVGTVKLQRKLPEGTVVDVDGTSKTAIQALTRVEFVGQAEFRFNFTRTSGTVTCTATSPSAFMDLSSAIRLEPGPGLLLLETLKPIALE